MSPSRPTADDDDDMVALVETDDVHLEGDRCYLISNSFLDSVSLRVHSVYRTLHCVTCETVHLPNAVCEHLKIHDIAISTKDGLTFLADVMKELNVRTTPDVKTPTPRGPPVECLKVVLDGHCCNYCNYCVPAFNTFWKHWYSSVHQDNKTTVLS